MSASLQRSLRSFFDARASARQAGGLLDRLKCWSAGRAWQRAAGRIAAQERAAALASLGRSAFDDDWGGIRTELESNVRSVEFLGDARRRGAFLREHCAFLFVSLLDSFVLADDALRAEALSQVEIRGAKYADAAFAAGRGAIFFGCHQSHGGFAFQHDRFADRQFAVVRNAAEHFEPEGGPERTYGRTVTCVPTAPAGLEQMVRSLTAGEGAVVYNDFCYPGTVALPGSLFGRPVGVSRSLVKLILRTKAPVLPVSVVRLQPFERGKILVEIHPPLPLGNLPQTGRDHLFAALRLSIATECLIRRHPVQWTHWSLLQYRWSEAARGAVRLS